MITKQDSQGYFDLVSFAISECFRPFNATERASDNEIKRIKERRKTFADSKLLKIWADCSDNFEYEKIKKLIIERNI